MSTRAVRGADPYTQGRFNPYDQPERAQCQHINCRPERTWFGRVHQCSDERSWQLIENIGRYARSCRTSGGEHQKGGVTALGANGGGIQGKGHLVMIMCCRNLRWHYGQDTWVSKRRHTSPHTWLKFKVDHRKSRPELTLSVVWWESHKLSHMLTCQHHSCGTISMITHTHTNTHKWGQSAALLESASHRAPGQTWVHWSIWSIPSVLQFWPTPGPKGSYKLVRMAF